MGTSNVRLIEVAFPLKQASLNSVHEKSVRHGHISTLHIWPARRPLAACRAALMEGSGSTVKLRPWHQRRRKTLGYDADGRPAPLIDQVHRLMHLWKAGDVDKVDDDLDARGLRKHALFLQLLQALIELAGEGTCDEIQLGITRSSV
jgi:hypothetical protein